MSVNLMTNQQKEDQDLLSSDAIITSHYLFSSLPEELVDGDILKIVHLDCFHSNDKVAQSAIELLRKIGDEKSHRYLFAIINDYPDDRKLWALETLYEIGNEDIIAPLLEYFKTSFDEITKSLLIKVLARYGHTNEEVKEIVLANTADELNDSPIRFAAIKALSEIKDINTLKTIVQSKNENIMSAGITALGKIDNIDSLHLIKRLCTQFKGFGTRAQTALIESLLDLKNDYVLELLKVVFLEGNEERIKSILPLIHENEFLRSFPIRLTKIFLRMPECSDETEQEVIDCFTEYYESFPEVSSKVSQELSEAIESLLRNYFAKFKVNYQKEYNSNLSLKTQIEKDLFFAKEYIEKFADEDFVKLISECLREGEFNPSSIAFANVIKDIKIKSHEVTKEYSVNLKAIIRLLQSRDKLERTRVAAYLNTVDFKKRHDISRLHRLLSYVSITKSNSSMDVAYEILKWGIKLQDKDLIETATLALGRSGHKVLIKEAEKTLFPMKDKMISMHALLGLGELAHKDSIPVILSFFQAQDFDEDLYLSTITALKKIGIKNERPILEMLLKIFISIPSDTIKYNAGMAFASLASENTIPALAKYKDSKTDKVREILPLMVGKLYESTNGASKEMTQNFYYALMKDKSLKVRLNATLMLYRLGDAYSLEVLKDIFTNCEQNELPDVILQTIEIDSIDKIYWLVNLLKSPNESIQRSVSISLVSLLEGESQNKKTIATLVKDLRLKPFKDKKIDEIDSIKETQLDLSKHQEKEKFQFERENTKELTILFIDITGYTKKSSSMELMEIMNYLKTYEEMALPIFAAHYGTVVKKMGDGLMISFPQALYGALAGIRLQEKLTRYNQFKPEKEKIITRVGLNTGPVAIQGTDLFGDAVNVASRMETSAKPGGVLVSESTFLKVRDYITWEDMGEITVKGKDVPIHSYHLLSINASLPQEMDPLISGDNAGNRTTSSVPTDSQSEIEK
ncbi:MAG: hypothetical protein OEZ36_02765, partial [Spirochaetota bacterium]|nr:hypothetical protein [Spirochaetota bacterium]